MSLLVFVVLAVVVCAAAYAVATPQPAPEPVPALTPLPLGYALPCRRWHRRCLPEPTLQPGRGQGAYSECRAVAGGPDNSLQIPTLPQLNTSITAAYVARVEIQAVCACASGSVVVFPSSMPLPTIATHQERPLPALPPVESDDASICCILAAVLGCTLLVMRGTLWKDLR